MAHRPGDLIGVPAALHMHHALVPVNDIEQVRRDDAVARGARVPKDDHYRGLLVERLSIGRGGHQIGCDQRHKKGRREGWRNQAEVNAKVGDSHADRYAPRASNVQSREEEMTHVGNP